MDPVMGPQSASSNHLTVCRVKLLVIIGVLSFAVGACGAKQTPANQNSTQVRPADKYDASAVAEQPDPFVATIDTVEALGDAGRELVAKQLKLKGAVVLWVSKSTLRARIAKQLVPDIVGLAQVEWLEPATTTNGPRR